MSVITRFPPSPTGYLHIGRARTALFNFLFTKKEGGKMVFRIEDTDKERSKKEYENDIVECLKWLGISYDEGPIRQSERQDIYKKYLHEMISAGTAFVSKEKSEKNENEMVEVVRFKNPNKKIVFNDLIRGEIEFDTTELGDFVIARSIDEPLYHLAVVVDDHEMGITHILRGEDGISNTPRQILIQEAIGAKRPNYAHIPLILAPDKSKLSGRHGAVSVSEYKKAGYLPEALVNFLVMLGWNPGDEQEILTLDDMIRKFTIEKIQKAGAVFNADKLKWFNRQYMMKLTDEQFTEMAKPFLPSEVLNDSKIWQRVLTLVREKVYTFGEIPALFQEGGELKFILGDIAYNPELLLWKKDPSKEATKVVLGRVKGILEALEGGSFDAESVKNALWSYAEEKGKGNVLWPTRAALTGQEKSPDPFVSAAILGKDESVKRIQNAIEILAK